MSRRKILVVGAGLNAALLDASIRSQIRDLAELHDVDIEVHEDVPVEALVDEAERLGLTRAPAIGGVGGDPWPEVPPGPPRPPGIKGKRQAQWKNEVGRRRR